MTAKKLFKKASAASPAKQLVCSICGKPTTRLVDGEPSCDDHAALVYENQLEDYTSAQMKEHAERQVRKN